MKVILAYKNRKITARINAADHLWTIGAFDKGRFLKAPGAYRYIIKKIRSFLKVAHDVSFSFFFLKGRRIILLSGLMLRFFSRLLF